MKLHLNLSLRRAILAAMAAVFAPSTLWAGAMHDDATVQTYADFGQNRGRYVVGSKVNALLSHIRTETGGIAIPYTDTDTPYIISNTQGMINFSGTADAGYAAMIGPTYMATVLHNGSLNGSFSERTVGSGHAINYEAIDIRNSSVFRLAPGNWNGEQYDYMLQRQSKVVTDVSWNQLTTLNNEQIANIGGSLLYHSGSGTKYMWHSEDNSVEQLAGAYAYIIGSINTISSGQLHDGATAEDGTNFSLHMNPDLGWGGEANEKYPLPLGAKPGDSGSPTYIYNTATGQYEYIAAIQSAGGNSYSQARGNIEWTALTMEAYNERVDMSSTGTVYLNAITTAGKQLSDTVGGVTHSTTLHTGQAVDASGNVLAEYTGIQSGTNTWKDLSYRKDKSNWYAFQNTTSTILGQVSVISDLNVTDADLFFTENLVFTPSQVQNSIILNSTVDLGIGYAEFNKGAGMDKAIFTISAADNNGSMFNHAGYVVNDGAEVHLKLTNPVDYMTEWRKIGKGDLYIDGQGDTNALLNVGGTGKTYLQQAGGYAAYNVLASSGATVIIKDLNQIKRDFTFGAGGGTLDMNGNSMDWYTTTDADGRFTINALTEEALITNSSAAKATLTFKEGGSKTYAGSFANSATGTLDIIYDGGGTWTLNSIRTDLSSSLFRVKSGKVVLSGTNTIHGIGSATGTNTTRYTNPDDWHYADAAMYVEIEDQATFELGSHARMRGDIWAKSGGSLVLREGVKHQYEYVEGGATKEDTYKYADFYGLQPGCTVMLDEGSSLKVEFSEGTTANTTLGATLYGKGSISVDAGLNGGTLTLSGSNSSLKGTKTLTAGGLIATNASSLGNTTTNKWLVGEKAWIASTSDTGTTLLNKLDGASTGIIALSSDTATALSLSGHKGLYTGAMAGKTINYGTTNAALAATDGQWKLGGGGGTLNVHFLLTGANDLIIGNEYSSGTVHLTNTGNSFTGDITIMGSGNILTYEDGALGNARVDLSYGNTLALHSAAELAMLKDGSLGVLSAADSIDLDLTGYSISLGAVGEQTYTNTLTVGDTYRFGGSGHLILDTDLGGADHMEIDGQGNEGSNITLVRENAYSGDIVAGGGLYLSEANSSGSIGIHTGHAGTLASLDMLQLQKGATLYTDGHSSMTVQNLDAQAGSAIVNNGSKATTLELRVTEGKETTLANGTLSDASNTAALTLVKTGKGTLSISGNSAWSGGISIQEGKVVTHAGNGGIGSADNKIHIGDNGTLRIGADQVSCSKLASTMLKQQFTGTGTIEVANGKDMLLTNQGKGFAGTVHVTDETRLYIGKTLSLQSTNSTYYDTVQAYDLATVMVDAGSQVRLTANLVHVYPSEVVSSADYIIAGQGKTGTIGNELVHEKFTAGALSIDCASTITGSVTLADHATIASWSNNPAATLYHPDGRQNFYGLYRCNSEYTAIGITQRYGMKEYVGGTIRGQILGKGKTLTLAGNEGITITADSANSFGDLVISNGNGSNDQKFALRLDGGEARSQTSTALGTGKVSLGEGLILRLAGTGAADQASVEYTYANDMDAADNATIQSYNITNKLTGTVTMTGSTLNLASAQGGRLELAGGISGNGTLNVDQGSKIELGPTSGDAQFGGSIVSKAGADIALASPSVVSESTVFSGTDSLTLRLGGTADYTLGGISLTSSADTATTLTLQFDFADAAISTTDATSYTTLSSGITAGSTAIAIELNMFETLQAGTYTLIDSFEGESFTLANNTSDNRLSLSKSSTGALLLTVSGDKRLYWAADGASQTWNSSDANWYQESTGRNVTFTSGDHIVFDARGAAGSSAETRETVTLARDLTVGAMVVKDAGAHYEITGITELTGSSLTVGAGGDLKLSTIAASFSDGVTVSNATLEVDKTRLTGNVSLESGASFAMCNNARLDGNLEINGSDATLSYATIDGNISTSGTGSLTMDVIALGNHSITFGSTAQLSLTGSTLSGNLQWQSESDTIHSTALNIQAGDASTDAALQVDTMSLSSSSKLTITGSRRSSIGSLTGGGALLLAEGSTATLNLGSANLASLDLLGGTTNISGAVSLASGARLSLGKASLNLNDGAIVTVSHYRSGDQGSQHPSSVSINKGATLNITGTNNEDNTNTSFLLTHWGSSASTMLLNGGTLNATNTSMQMGWDSGATFTALAGEANLKGVRFSSARGHAETFALGTSTEGSARINIGADGIRGIGSNDTVSLGEGTIGALADYSITGHAINLTGTRSGTIFDTNGHTVTLNTTLNGNGILSKTGEGRLSLAGNGTAFTGSLNITRGTVSLESNTSIGQLASLTMGNGATLDLSSFGSEVNSAITLAEGATVSISSGAVLAFGELTAATQYTIFDMGADCVLEGWDADNLSAANFSINGVSMSDMGRVELALNADTGSFSYFLNSCDLIWNGGESGSWNSDTDNTCWLQSLGGAAGDTAYSFANNDNVSILNSATIEITEDVRVGSLTIDSEACVTIQETGSLTANSIVVNAGSTLNLSSQKVGYSEENISGAGTVALNFTSDWGNKLKLGDSFTGEAYVTGGALDLVGVSAGNTLRLADGVNANSADSSATLTANLILEGSTIIHANTSKPITYEGTVTGESGIFKSNGGSSHTFQNEVNLAGFETQNSSSTNTFNGKTTLKSANISQSTVNFNGETSITSATISGGTVNIATGKLSIASLTHNAGNINFKQAAGAQKTTYSVGAIGGSNYASLVVDKGVTLNATSITTPGSNYASAARTLTVNGEMNLSQGIDMRYSKGLTFAGSGLLKVDGNINLQHSQGSTTNISVNKLNIGGNLSLNSYWHNGTNHQVNLTGGTTTVQGKLYHESSGRGSIALNINGGSMVLMGGGNMSQGSTSLSAGSLVQSGGTTTVSNAFTMSGGELIVRGGVLDFTSAPTVSGGIISIEAGTLALHQDEATLVITAPGTAGRATMENKGASGSYSTSNASWELTGARLKSTGGAATLGNKLTNASIENAGSGLLTLTHAGNTLTEILATNGNITVQNMNQLAVQQLGIASGKTITADRSITVSGQATFGTGASLNAGLTLVSGATLSMAEALTMSGDLNLASGLTLSGALLSSIQSATSGSVVTLFEGLESLTLAGGVLDSIDRGDEMAVSSIFSNLQNTNGHEYYFVYSDDSLGIYCYDEAYTQAWTSGILEVRDKMKVAATGGELRVVGDALLRGELVNTELVAAKGNYTATVEAGIMAGSRVEVNGGELILTGANNYTGGTVLKDGVLALGHAGALGSGEVLLQGGTLRNDSATASSISTAAVKLAGAELEGGFTLAGSTGWDVQTDTCITGSLLLDGGTLTLHNTSLDVSGEVNLGNALIILDGTYELGSTYTLLTAGSFMGSTAGLTISGFDDYTLDIAEGVLSITLNLPIVNLTWLNTKKAVWQEGASGWQDSEEGTETSFANGDNVSISDGNVTIVGEVAPGAVHITTGKSLAFKTGKTAPGSIAGDDTTVTIDAAAKAKVTFNDGNTYGGGTIINSGIVNATGADSFGTGEITLNGGTLNMAGKQIANELVLDGAATIKAGAKYTGEFSMTGGELLKGSVLNIEEEAFISGGTINGTLSGSGFLSINGEATLGSTGKLTVKDVDISGILNISSKGLALNAKDSLLTLTGDTPGTTGALISEGKVSGCEMGMYGGELRVSNAKPVAVSFKRAFTASDKADINIYGGFTTSRLELTDSTFTVAMAEQFRGPKNQPKAQTVNLNGKNTYNVVDNSHINIEGKMSVAGNLWLSGTSSISLADPSGKNAAMPLAVKGNLTLGSGCTLTLSGALSARDMVLDGGTINLTGAKLATIKVSGALTLNAATDINYNFAVTQKDVDKGKTFKILTFKSSNLQGQDVESLHALLGLSEDYCTLVWDKKQTALSLKVTDLDGWNEAMVSDGDAESAQESPAAVTALVNPVLPDYSGVADALVQANWGLVESSRAFVNTIANRSMAVQLGSGERAVWASAIAGSSRRSSSGTHGGADTNITGGAIGMETQLGENSLLGMALGNSRARVSAHNYGTIKQDTTHLGVYGQTNWNKLSADWSAAYGRSESKSNGSDWSQRAIQLDGRLSYNHALSETVLLRGFGGVQYYASDSARVDGLNTGEVQNLRGEIGVGIVRSTYKSSVYAELALHQDLVRDNPEVRSPFGQRYHGTNPGRTGINFTIGGSYALSDQWSLNASYTAEFEQNANVHSVNVGATFKF